MTRRLCVFPRGSARALDHGMSLWLVVALVGLGLLLGALVARHIVAARNDNQTRAIVDLVSDRHGEHIAFLKEVGRVVREPDGQVSYERTRDTARTYLFLYQVSGQATEIFDNLMSEPVYSPAEPLIAVSLARDFATMIREGAHVAIIDPARRSVLWRSTLDDQSQASPVWSPDGRHLAYEWVSLGEIGKRTAGTGKNAAEPGPQGAGTSAISPWARPNVSVLSMDGKTERTVVRGAMLKGWFAGGRKLLLRRDGDLYSIAADGNGEERLTYTGDILDAVPLNESGKLLMVRWYPEQEEKRLELCQRSRAVWSVPIDGYAYESPVVSPDSTEALLKTMSAIIRIDLTDGHHDVVATGRWSSPIWVDEGRAVACVHKHKEIWLFTQMEPEGKMIFKLSDKD